MNKLNKIITIFNSDIHFFTLKSLFVFLMIQFILIFTPYLTPIKFWEIFILIWIFFSRKYYQLKIVPKIAAKKEEEKIIHLIKLNQIIKKYRAKIPESSVLILLDIKDIITELVRNEELLEMEDKFLLKQSIKDYIPTTIKRFLALPNKTLENFTSEKQKKAIILFDDQLIVIKNKHLNILKTVSEVAYNDILKNQRFLQYRLSPNIQQDFKLNL